MFELSFPYTPNEYRTVSIPAIIQHEDATTSTATTFTSPEEPQQSSELHPELVATEANSAEAGFDEMLINLRIPPDEWTPSLEGKFSGLVLKKAHGKLTAKEAALLSEMRLDRRRLLNPRSVEEITDGYRRWFATERLIAALDQYVKVHPRKTYTSSRRP